MIFHGELEWLKRRIPYTGNWPELIAILSWDQSIVNSNFHSRCAEIKRRTVRRGTMSTDGWESAHPEALLSPTLVQRTGRQFNSWQDFQRDHHQRQLKWLSDSAHRIKCPFQVLFAVVASEDAEECVSNLLISSPPLLCPSRTRSFIKRTHSADTMSVWVDDHHSQGSSAKSWWQVQRHDLPQRTVQELDVSEWIQVSGYYHSMNTDEQKLIRWHDHLHRDHDGPLRYKLPLRSCNTMPQENVSDRPLPLSLFHDPNDHLHFNYGLEMPSESTRRACICGLGCRRSLSWSF